MSVYGLRGVCYQSQAKLTSLVVIYGSWIFTILMLKSSMFGLLTFPPYICNSGAAAQIGESILMYMLVYSQMLVRCVYVLCVIHVARFGILIRVWLMVIGRTILDRPTNLRQRVVGEPKCCSLIQYIQHNMCDVERRVHLQQDFLTNARWVQQLKLVSYYS